MLGAIKRSKERQFGKGGTLQSLFGHLNYTAVINVGLRMKSRNNNRGRKGIRFLVALKGMRVCDRKWRR